MFLDYFLCLELQTYMDKINQYLTLLGNLGVVVGLVFLVIEIQNNTRATEGQTRDAMTERVINWQMNISANEFTATALSKAVIGEELSQSESLAVQAMVLANIRIWENEYYQYRQGLFSVEEFTPRIAVIEGNMKRCPYRKNWDGGGTDSPEFSAFINKLVSGPCA